MASVCVACGLDVNSAGQLYVKTCAGGGITCDPTSGCLKIDTTQPLPPGTTLPGGAISIGDGSTTTHTGTGAAGDPIKFEVKRSTDACQGLKTGADGGLWVPCPDSITGAFNYVSDTTFTGPMTAGGNFGFNGTIQGDPSSLTAPGAFSGVNGQGPVRALQICNNLCCEMSGFVSVAVGTAVLTGSGGFSGDAFVGVAYNYVGSPSGFGAASPGTVQNLRGDGIHDISNMQDYNFLALAPGQCAFIVANLNVHINSGVGNMNTPPDFEYTVHLTQSGCC